MNRGSDSEPVYLNVGFSVPGITDFVFSGEVYLGPHRCINYEGGYFFPEGSYIVEDGKLVTVNMGVHPCH